MCGRREQETALPLRRLPARLEGIRDGGRVSARRSKSPKPTDLNEKSSGPPMVPRRVRCECWGAHPTRASIGTCLHTTLPGNMPAHPCATLIATTPSPCEGLLRGRRYQGCEREAWSRGSVPSHTHARQPPTHPPEPGMEAALYVILLSPLFFTCPVTNSPWS